MDTSALSSVFRFHTLDVFGFYLPPILLWALMALIPYLLARWGLRRTGFYRFVWHRPLFDMALYVIIFGAMVLGLPALGGMQWL